MKVSHRTRRLMASRRALRERRVRSRWTGGVLQRDDDPVMRRRWEGADTNRLNRAHWSHAFGRTINEDLYERLETLRIRCEYEVANDPILEGVLATVAGDVVGPEGPRVQVLSDDDRFNSILEEAIAEYLAWPDPTVGTVNAPVAMADCLKTDIRSLCTAGEFIHQYTNARRAGPFEFAIRSPHPRRLENEPGQSVMPGMFMGLELAPNGAVTHYHFRDEPPGLYARTSYTYRRVAAENVQHQFIRHEQDQLRGFPWLAVSLNDMADRRDLNKFVMESAKNAAAQGILWFTDHPEAMVDLQFSASGETHPLEPGMQQAGPPGYKPFMINPTQPGANWREFEHEKLRGYGRPFGMPLMMVLLSSEGNSFSGANHDGQIYIRSCQGLQKWLERGTLTPQFNQIAVEVALATGRKRPRTLAYAYTWPLPPHPDPKKNYEAIRMQLEDGALSLSDACAMLGRDFETVQLARKYVNEQLDALELPRPPINLGSAQRPSGVLRDVADALEAQQESDADDGSDAAETERRFAGAR